MSLNADQLFALLPAVYRNRDAALGGPLQALYAVLAQQLGIVEDNIEQLYDDQFIETCATWVIPYIGDLIGYNSIYEVRAPASTAAPRWPTPSATAGAKAPYSRWNSYPAMFPGGPRLRWRSSATSSPRRVCGTCGRTTRPQSTCAAWARSTGWAPLLIGRRAPSMCVALRPRLRPALDPDPAPLEIALHGPGRSNIPDIAIHLWRLKSRPVPNAPAFALGDGRYMFSPLGQDMPLFSQPPAARLI